jgi:alanine racemase
MVRLGIGAYGVWPSREARLAAREKGVVPVLEPVMTWKTRIVQLKKVEVGEYVGYGQSFQAGRPMTLAVIPVGYYEGYDRSLSGVGRALVRGKHVSVVGRVAMNMTMLDVTDVGAARDDEVVIVGRQGDQEVSADELADKAGTISYEVLARINPLLERRGVDS